jgi:hypothetical protein
MAHHVSWVELSRKYNRQNELNVRVRITISGDVIGLQHVEECIETGYSRSEVTTEQVRQHLEWKIGITVRHIIGRATYNEKEKFKGEFDVRD